MTAVDLPMTWGAVPLGDGTVRFHLWAPDCDRVDLRLDGTERPMEPRGQGWFRAAVEARAGAQYQFILPEGMAVPDPAAFRQHGDVHGPSLVTSDRFAWQTDWAWRPWEEAVICELHVGTFTPGGTFRAAMTKLDALSDAGYTAIEIMPVAQFGGDRGWGYDGVLPYAPHPAYGSPDDLRALVDAAHARGLMVLLDVVYNHFGPDGNYLHAYASPFFDESRHTPWGAGIDYRQEPVRRFFIENALYWLASFRLDGLRLDAVDQIRDPSEPPFLVELAQEVRERIDRPVHLTTEDNRNLAWLHARRNRRPVLYTGEWNDDFHNAAHVAATGETEGYYEAFADDPWRHLGRALAEGFSYQGPERGEPSGHLPPVAFIDFLQNHDQTGNRALGERLISLTDSATHDALTAILLLSPHIPLMFMGEEWGETRPFRFFAGFEGDLGRAVTEGRRKEFAAFAAFKGHTERVPDPIDPATMEKSRIDWERRESGPGQAALSRVRMLLDTRRSHIVPRLARTEGNAGRLLLADAGALAVDWQLDGALLQLRANLSGRACELPPASGEPIHALGERGAPHSVIHVMEVHE